ncbi:hypothetical protein GCM10010442_32850 [Kitasatospora kifunensis]
MDNFCSPRPAPPRVARLIALPPSTRKRPWWHPNGAPPEALSYGSSRPTASGQLAEDEEEADVEDDEDEDDAEDEAPDELELELEDEAAPEPVDPPEADPDEEPTELLEEERLSVR